jgi:uncharacterized protein (DUF1778 family)
MKKPKKKPNRDHGIIVRLRADEHEALRKLAEADNRTMADFIRVRVLKEIGK